MLLLATTVLQLLKKPPPEGDGFSFSILSFRKPFTGPMLAPFQSNTVEFQPLGIKGFNLIFHTRS
jgi:hypothetical protein